MHKSLIIVFLCLKLSPGYNGNTDYTENVLKGELLDWKMDWNGGMDYGKTPRNAFPWHYPALLCGYLLTNLLITCY